MVSLVLHIRFSFTWRSMNIRQWLHCKDGKSASAPPRQGEASTFRRTPRMTAMPQKPSVAFLFVVVSFILSCVNFGFPYDDRYLTVRRRDAQRCGMTCCLASSPSCWVGPKSLCARISIRASAILLYLMLFVITIGDIFALHVGFEI